MKALGVHRLGADAAQHARDLADHVEVAEQRGGARLLVAEAVAVAAATLRDRHLGGALGPRRGRLAHHRQSPLLGPQVAEEIDPLLPHLGQIAGHAAVVTDQPAPVGAGLFEVGVVDEHARGLATRRAEPIVQGLLVLAGEEPILQPHVDVGPGQGGAERERAQVAAAVDPEVLESLLPDIEFELVVPGVEVRPAAIGPLQHVGERPVPAGEDALEHAGVGLVGAELHGAVRTGGVAEDLLLPGDLGERVHRGPLKGRVRLGHVGGDAHRHLGGAAAGGALAHRHRARAGLHDAAHVVVGLGGQADHEVELHLPPAAGKDALGRLVELLLGDVLVHHVAHPRCARLRSEGEPGGAHLLDLVEQLGLEAISAQRRDAERDALLGEPARHLLHERGDAGDIGGGERRERDLVLAAVLHRADHGLDDLLGIALAHRAVDHPRLAEATTLGAAAGDLDRQAIEDGLRPADGAIVGEGVFRQVHQRSLDGKGDVGHDGPVDHHEPGVGVDPRLVEGRHVDGAQAGEGDQPISSGDLISLEPRPGERHLRGLLLAVADDEGVDEGGQRLGVGGRGAAGDHQRIGLAAIGRAERHAAEVEHAEDVGIGQLELQGEAHHVEVAERARALQRHQRQRAGAELRLQVDPGRITALGQGPRIVVEQLVEDLEAEVAHPDVVDVGESQADRGLDGGPVLDDGAHLAPGVAGGLLHAIEETGVRVARQERKALHGAAA